MARTHLSIAPHRLAAPRWLTRAFPRTRAQVSEFILGQFDDNATSSMLGDQTVQEETLPSGVASRCARDPLPHMQHEHHELTKAVCAW